MNLSCKISAGSCLAVTIVFIVGLTGAAKPPEKKEARVTQIIKEVNLLPSEGSARPAVQNDEVKENTAVRTGDESRSELTFEDLTITRLGANTVFSFNKAGRSGQLDSGSILLRVPENSGGAEFRTRAVTVGITGTVVIFESTRQGNSKLMVLAGKARLALIKDPKQTKNVRAGQLLDVKADAITLPEPMDVDLDQIMKTHPLITDFPPLPSQDLIGATTTEGGGGCAQVADKDIRCEPNGGYSYNFTVANSTAGDMSQILLTPLPGSTFTLSQQLFNLPSPLHNGQSTTVTLNIGNAKAGDKVCFFVSLMSEGASCCNVQVCLTLPRCGDTPNPTRPLPQPKKRR